MPNQNSVEKFTPNFLRNSGLIALKELEYKSTPAKDFLLYDSLIKNDYNLFEKDFENAFNCFPSPKKTYKLQNAGCGHLMPKRKFIDSRKFEFSEQTAEVARDIYNFEKSGFDKTLIGASNLERKDRKRVDKNLNDLAPPPKKTALAQAEAFKALPSE